jgi:UDP-glucose 4-epimerase
MTILVTGGAGYIGSHTCVELLNEGYEIIVIDNFSNSKLLSMNRVSHITNKTFKVLNIDLLNKSLLDSVFKHNNITSVIHFAGLKAVGESINNPLKYYMNNVTGTLNLCEIMMKYGVKNMVFSSSATVYGTNNDSPISEKQERKALNPYGKSKLMIEDILLDLYAADKTWSIALLRYFNPIGAHESGLIGEDPKGVPNNLLPYISQVAIGKLKELNIFGNDYPTEDGTGIRDYIHVVDLAKGHLRALEWVSRVHQVEAFNLGTGKGYSVLEILKTFEDASEKTIPHAYKSRRPGDAAICFANPSKARTILNWEPSKNLFQMCKDNWRWQNSNPNGYETSSRSMIT